MDATRFEELCQGLRRLKLRRIREVLEDYNRLAVTQQLSYLDFLAGLVQEEVAARDETQHTKRLKAARLPCHKTIEDFDFQFQTSVSRQTVLELARLRFIENHENCALIVTSNRPFQEWGSVFASTSIATATLDRLLHHVHILNLQGDSYRLKERMPTERV